MLNAAKTQPDMRRAGMLLTAVIFALAVLLPPDSAAQWSAGPGETVRNAFGPSKNQHVPVCRGACGMDCPSSCEQDEEFQCAGAGALIRVQTYSCGTHLGCRQHDDCLDNCSQQHGEGYDCQAECHAEAVEDAHLGARHQPLQAQDAPPSLEALPAEHVATPTDPPE